jgi:hypothetical protein
MAGLMAGIAIMLIFSTRIFQAWEDVLHRDNEAEMIFRAQDIVRGIQRYRQDHGGAGPLKLEDLMEPGPRGQYYLRRLYEDPLVPNGKWCLLYVAPDGSILDPTGAPAAPPGLEGPRSIFDDDAEDDRRGPGRGRGRRPARSRLQGAAGAQGLQGTGDGGLQTPGPPVDLSQTDPTEPSGLPIAGVKSLSQALPFRFYKGQTSYGEWRFTYLDLEQMQVPGQGQNLAPGQQPPRPGMQPRERPRGQRPRAERP